MPGSDFRAHKPSEMDKKRLQNIYANHPKTIVNQYFGFSSIVLFVKARYLNFTCQEVILEPNNHQNGTKSNYETFMKITIKRS